MQHSRSAWLLIFCALAACPVSQPSVGVDGGEAVDAGVVADAGVEEDAGAEDAGVLDAGPGDAGPADAGVRSLRVLFIGNSYTYVNDLPAMLGQLSGGAITTDAVVVGGATLEDHWNTGDAQRRIADGGWTHVVLQEQSVTPALYPTTFKPYARRLTDVVADAGAVPVFYVTWARAPGDAIYKPPFGFFVTPEHMQDALTNAYVDAADASTGSILSCVGEAFRRSQREHPELVLIQSDLSHPTVAGTYLAAQTFHQTLRGQPSAQLGAVPGLTEPEAQTLRDVARASEHCERSPIKAIVTVEDERGSLVYEGPDGGPPFSFGTAGTELTVRFRLWNQGGSSAGLADGMTLAPPFAWATGSFPGGALPTDCTGTLAPQTGCFVSVTYSGASSASGRLTVQLSNAYAPGATRALQGTTTNRALLAVSSTPGLTECTDVDCSLRPLSFVSEEGLVTQDVFVTNRGGAATTALAPAAPLDAGFFWGPPDGGGAFPGNTGASACSGVLPPGAECTLTLTFAAAARGVPAQSTLELESSDALGPVSPNVRRPLYGMWLPDGGGGIGF